ncbi:MAG: hypothetical protein RR758_09460 [Burkholderiaceae bacterium]
MAIGWMTVLKSVPWGDVISNAPAIADGAQKLWGAARNKVGAAPEPAPAPASPASAVDPESPLAAFEARIAQLEANTLALRQQMLESSELITRLADQNSALIRRIEILRRRLVMAMLAVTVLAASGLAVTLLR